MNFNKKLLFVSFIFVFSIYNCSSSQFYHRDHVMI